MSEWCNKKTRTMDRRIRPRSAASCHHYEKYLYFIYQSTFVFFQKTTKKGQQAQLNLRNMHVLSGAALPTRMMSGANRLARSGATSSREPIHSWLHANSIDYISFLNETSWRTNMHGGSFFVKAHTIKSHNRRTDRQRQAGRQPKHRSTAGQGAKRRENTQRHRD